MKPTDIKKLKRTIASTVARVVTEALDQYDSAIKSALVEAINPASASTNSVTTKVKAKAPRKPRKPRTFKQPQPITPDTED